MSEAKKSGPFKLVRSAIIAVGVLLAGGLLYQCQGESSSNASANPSGKPEIKMPSAATPGSTSGQGSLRSTDAGTQQSLSGKTINAPQSLAEGKVVDSAGKGIPDVRVQCTNCQTKAALALSDENGDFKLPYHFEPSGDIQQMVIMVSKGKQSTKHTISGTSAQRLKLELK